MSASEVKDHPALKKIVGELATAAGTRLRGVVLYGSAARGDFHRRTSDFNLLLVLEDLGPSTLEALAPAIRQWVKGGQPIPRIFTPALIAESADVFPVEFLDIQGSHLVLQGEDPLVDLKIGLENLRLQCERELREKMMRLREGYIQTHDRPKDLRRLLTDSYTTFVALFRGCLQLVGGETPRSNVEVVTAFCEKAGLDRAAFEAVDRLKRGEEPAEDLKRVFERYYDELTRAVRQVDRFDSRQGGQSR